MAPSGRLLIVALTLLTLAGLIALGVIKDAPSGMKSEGGFAAIAALLGAIAGASELVSRYRDEPLQALTTGSAVAYLLLNALASVAAYALLTHYAASIVPSLADDRVMRSIVAGLGSMAILRLKFFTLRTEAGEDVAVGPDAAIAAFLAAADRGVDRARASRRLSLVFERASQVIQPKLGRDFLEVSMAALQNLSTDEKTQLVGYLDKISASPYPDNLKLQAISYGILNLAGERNYIDLMSNLEQYAARQTQPGNP